MTTEVNITPAPVQTEDGLNIQTSDQYFPENAGVTIAEATQSEVLSPEMSEDEMNELAELDRYYSEMSAGELLQETEFESYWGKLSALDLKLAEFTPEETHHLAELMASRSAAMFLLINFRTNELLLPILPSFSLIRWPVSPSHGKPSFSVLSAICLVVLLKEFGGE